MRLACAVQVACALSSRVALHRVTTCVGQLGGRTLALSAAAILGAVSGPSIDVVVFDLEPGDASAPKFVRRIKATRPDWPVLIYYEPRMPIIERVTEVAPLPGVWTTAQVERLSQPAELQTYLEHVIQSVPLVRLLHYVDPLLRALPSEVRGYLESQLGHRVANAPGELGIDDTARGLAGRRRRLERACQAAGVATPKRLLDHVLLAYLTYKASAFNKPLGVAASGAGIPSKPLRALLQRVTSNTSPWADLSSGRHFEFALMALANACKAHPRVVEDILSRAAAGGRP